MYYLCKNVYVVDGAVNAAIYDLNRHLLYQLSKAASLLLYKCLEEDYFCEEEQIGINNFINKGLITAEYVTPHKITELIRETTVDFAWIEVTTKCNYKCIHCYEEASICGGNTMSYDDFCHVVDELQEYGIEKIQLIGGEPCILGNELLHYLDYAVGKFENIMIYTNGSLVTDEMISYFKENKIYILLSIYSYASSVHDSVTKVDGSHARTIKILSRFKEAGILFKTKNVIMKGVYPGDKNTDLYTLNQHKDIVRLTGRANIELLSFDLLKRKMITRDNFKRPISKEYVSRLVSGHNCFSRRLYFSWDLNVYPCVMERRISHGNLHNSKLFNLINTNIIKMNKDTIEECKECELRYACSDCRPDSLGRNLSAKPWQCTYLPYKGIWQDATKQAEQVMAEYKCGEEIL